MIRFSAWISYEQNRPTGLVCPECTIQFFGEKCLKNALYRNFFQTKVITNQKPQLLCYVTFFDISRHFRVIAASEICSVSESRKYCAVLRNRFLCYMQTHSWKNPSQLSHISFTDIYVDCKPSVQDIERALYPQSGQHCPYSLRVVVKYLTIPCHEDLSNRALFPPQMTAI